MRQPIRVLLLVLLLLLPQPGRAGETFFVAPEQIDLTRLLAPPPAVGSPEQQRDMAELLALQKERTPEQEALAQADEERSVYRFADVVGTDFTPDKLPLATALFAAVKKTAAAVVDPSKDYWHRPRPYMTNPELHPCLHKPSGPSYPSNHATFATVTGIILADMIPEKAAQIHARAALFRFNRELGGVHYPGDVEAGRLAGTVIAAFLLQNQAFLSEYAKARTEVRQVLGLAP
jgi:acid phosphatase (class A)